MRELWLQSLIDILQIPMSLLKLILLFTKTVKSILTFSEEQDQLELAHLFMTKILISTSYCREGLHDEL